MITTFSGPWLAGSINRLAFSHGHHRIRAQDGRRFDHSPRASSGSESPGPFHNRRRGHRQQPAGGLRRRGGQGGTPRRGRPAPELGTLRQRGLTVVEGPLPQQEVHHSEPRHSRRPRYPQKTSGRGRRLDRRFSTRRNGVGGWDPTTCKKRPPSW